MRRPTPIQSSFCVAYATALLTLACSSADNTPSSAWPVPDAAVSLEAGPAIEDSGKPDATEADHAEDEPSDAPLSEMWEAAAAPCPDDMVLVVGTCVDRYEAPNRAGALPFVMFHFLEAQSWCEARGKRLCYDDEWVRACEGPPGFAYPYGDEHTPGVCNDDKLWKAYDQELLNGWPWKLDTDAFESLEEVLDAARASSAAGKLAADHVAALYQGEPSGSNAGCVGLEGVADLTGNVEEWTRRRDGGTKDFHGNLKGRYWAEARTCQQGVTAHGDLFRFYEIGFRCCRDPSK